LPDTYYQLFGFLSLGAHGQSVALTHALVLKHIRIDHTDGALHFSHPGFRVVELALLPPTEAGSDLSFAMMTVPSKLWIWLSLMTTIVELAFTAIKSQTTKQFQGVEW